MRWLRVASALMGLLFVFGVVVQINDPDPARWIFVYALAAGACLLAVRSRLPRWLPLLTAAVAIVWAATLAPGVVGRVNPLDMFDEFEMKSELIEQAREMFGLLIIAAWMLVLAFVRPRRTS
jgi:hypothetical protein